MNSPIRVTVVDNFDSFTFNLVDEFARRGCPVTVWRNDTPVPHLLKELDRAPTGHQLLVLSPGPGSPADAGCCIEFIRRIAGRVPILGVCLGHQAIIEAYGGTVGPAGEVVHGRSSALTHDGDVIFDGLHSPFVVGRYHSLAGTEIRAPIRPIAWSGSIVMAVRHQTLPILGVQFHPESILTPEGGLLLQNVLHWVESTPLPPRPQGRRDDDR